MRNTVNFYKQWAGKRIVVWLNNPIMQASNISNHPTAITSLSGILVDILVEGSMEVVESLLIRVDGPQSELKVSSRSIAMATLADNQGNGIIGAQS